MASFSDLTPKPADPLLGLMAAFREDNRNSKVDLGVGVYRDETGHTPIMKAVKLAEDKLMGLEDTKVYEGPRGNAHFVAEIDRLVFGDTPSDARDGFSTPGGCGALSLAKQLITVTDSNATLWISDPTWPNHLSIAKAVGLKTAAYPYAAPGDTKADLNNMLEGLAGAKRGDAVLIQGPCHNPTGIDIATEDWKTLGDYCVANGLLPLIDIAYHGFASSLEEDIKGVRTFLDLVPQALVCYSCSKNFGLYRERTGCLLIKAETAAAAQAAGSHVASISRASYSMPPAHGQAIVATILGNAALRTQWEDELNAMRIRVISLRTALADALHPSSNSYDPHALKAQNGMFSQLPMAKESIETLRTEGGVYMPGSGRINIAGLTTEVIPGLAEKLSPYL